MMNFFTKGIFFSFLGLLCCLSFSLTAQPTVELELYASGFSTPTDIASAGDDRLFVTERQGAIKIIDGNGNTLPEPFIDLNSIVINTSGQSEQGLLGLVFHPDYQVNGYFYVNYIANDGDTRVSRFSVDPADPNKGNPGSELILIEIDQPFGNHNGGDLNFGPDGYLYIGMGDGGSFDDPQNNGQDRLSLLGKMLRIDVDNGNPYSIPPDNPFAEDDFTLDEIWALGLRNPWRFSFDRQTGDMWIGDVGQGEWEEVDFQPADSPGGENYGWRCYEADDLYITSGGCEPADSMTFPVAKYPHPSGFGCASITGGYVYRGSANPDLDGWYLYADYCFQEIWGVKFNGSEWEHVQMGDFSGPYGFITFGEDEKGEMYVGTFQGSIYRIRSGDCATLSAQTSVVDDCDDQGIGEINLAANGGTPPYTFDPPPALGYFAGDYLFRITDALGCEYEINASVQNNETPVNIPEIEIDDNFEFLFVPDTFGFYQWYLEGIPLTNNGPDYVLEGEYGCFTVDLGDAPNCTAETNLFCIDPEAISSVENNELFQLYPNPARDRIYLVSKENPLKDVSLEMTDTQGRQVLFFREKAAFLQKEINLSTLTPGIYLVKIKVGEKAFAGKMVISK